MLDEIKEEERTEVRTNTHFLLDETRSEEMSELVEWDEFGAVIEINVAGARHPE